MNTYRLLIILPIMLMSLKSCSQEKNCNQTVRNKDLIKKIPNFVCIPFNHHIRYIKSQKDINDDGMNDLVIAHSKINPKDGDSLYIAIYTQKKDSTYILKKDLGNLHPMFMDDRRDDIYIKNSKSEILRFSYDGMYPFESLSFLEKEIVLKIEIGPGETMELHFVYRKEKDNWFLEWGIYESKLTKVEEEVLGEDNDFEPVKEKIFYNQEEQISIDEFNYFDWI